MACARRGRRRVELPIADGGEGTADALHAALGGEWHEAVVSDPLGRPHPARWLVLPDGRAVVEAAAAIGLPLARPRGARSARRVEPRARRARARRRCASRRASSSSGSAAARPSTAGRGCARCCASFPFRRRCSATCGRRSADAARLFGPQKGATPETVPVLERRLAGMDELAPYAGLPAPGAAGGLGAAFAALGAELVEGAPTVLDLVGFDERLREADLVVTGEGQVDRTTVEGKAPGVVAARCAAAGVRCVVFGGRVVEPVAGAETVSLSGEPRERRRGDLEDGSERTSASPNETRRAARRSAIDSSSFQATCGRASTNGRKTKTGSPYAFTSRRRRDGRGARPPVDECDLAERRARAHRGRRARRAPRPTARRSRRRRT